jgi:hypothetical protein
VLQSGGRAKYQKRLPNVFGSVPDDFEALIFKVLRGIPQSFHVNVSLLP